MDKKAQTWSMDVTIAFSIFVMGVLVFYVYSINYNSEAIDTINSISYDGELAFNNILTEPRPLDWNENNVIKIGIINNGKVNQSLLERFYYFANSDYDKTKSLLNSKYDYFLSFDNNMTINSTSARGIGKPGTKINNISSENLIKITRFTIYKDNPETIYLYIWN